MRRTSTGPILLGVALVILIGLFAYFGYQLNRQDKKLASLQTTILDDGEKVSGLINFINSSLAAQQQQTNK